MKKFCAVSRGLVMASALAFGCLFASNATATETYVVGVEAAFPPWAYVEQGEFKGIAIEAIRAIAQDQGFEVEIRDLPWPSLIPALSAGKIDILATGLTVTEQRTEVIDFSIPWWESNNVVLAPEDSDKNVFTAVCCGATVGVQGGSSQQEWMEGHVTPYMDTELATYDSYVTAVKDMLIGRIDSVITDATTGYTFIEKGRPIKVVGKIFTRKPLALAVTEGDPKGLLDDLNQGIMDIAESGAWEKIVHKYIPGVVMPPVPSYMPDFVEQYKKPVAGLPELGN